MEGPWLECRAGEHGSPDWRSSTAVGCGRHRGCPAPGGGLGGPRCLACLLEPMSLQVSSGSRCGLASAPHGQTRWLALGRPQQLSWAEGWPGPQKPSSPTRRCGEGPGVGDRRLVKRTWCPTGRPRGPAWARAVCPAGTGVLRVRGRRLRLGPLGRGLPAPGARCEQSSHTLMASCAGCWDVDGPAGGSAPGTEPKVQSQDGGGFWEKGPLGWVLRSWMPSRSSRPRNPKETSRSVRLGGCLDQPQLPRR